MGSYLLYRSILFICMFSIELHDLHNDYPLAPELMEVNKIEKLIPNLNNKTKYIIHHEPLKLYEKLGLRISKIHRDIKFVESNWLEPYIMKNTNLRMQGKNNFEKDFFKLMNRPLAASVTTVVKDLRGGQPSA